MNLSPGFDKKLGKKKYAVTRHTPSKKKPNKTINSRTNYRNIKIISHVDSRQEKRIQDPSIRFTDRERAYELGKSIENSGCQVDTKRQERK